MARPGLTNHRKFRRACSMLGIPKPHMIGHLELLWAVAYEAGDPYLGDKVDVEAAAEWVGTPGKLADALAGCGGRGHAGFIEKSDRGGYQVHDLWDHAPEYVSGRRSRELLRKRNRVCEHCAGIFHSADQRARYCGDACRSAAFRERERHGRERSRPFANAAVTENHTTPSPSPSPSPITTETVTIVTGAGASGPTPAVESEPVVEGPTETPVVRKLTPQQEAVELVVQVFQDLGLEPPTPSVIGQWRQLLGSTPKLVDLLLELGGAGHLDKGTSYVFAAVRNLAAGKKPPPPPTAIGTAGRSSLRSAGLDEGRLAAYASVDEEIVIEEASRAAS